MALQPTVAMTALLSDASGHRSRENIETAASGLVPGAVMETRDAGVTWTAITNVDLTAGTQLAVLLGPATTGLVAVATRDCEVFASQLSWPTLGAGRQDDAIERFAEQGVIIRA